MLTQQVKVYLPCTKKKPGEAYMSRICQQPEVHNSAGGVKRRAVLGSKRDLRVFENTMVLDLAQS